MSDQERALYGSVAWGEVDLFQVQWELLAALVVRTNRLMRHEGVDKGDVSLGLVTSAFRLIRQALETLDWDQGKEEEEVALDVADVHEVVNDVFEKDPELVVSHCPMEIQDDVRDAMGLE